MIRLGALVRNVLASGTASALASTGILLLTGRRDSGSAYAPVNAVSHWLFGDRAKRQHRVSAKCTVAGFVTHYAASMFWSGAFEALCALRRTPTATTRIVDGAAVAALACFVDYRMTPDRLKPGFEARLSRRSLALVYAGFALGLALGAQAMHENVGTARAGAD